MAKILFGANHRKALSLGNSSKITFSAKKILPSNSTETTFNSSPTKYFPFYEELSEEPEQAARAVAIDRTLL